jgi:hypothetical protein
MVALICPISASILEGKGYGTTDSGRFGLASGSTDPALAHIVLGFQYALYHREDIESVLLDQLRTCMRKSSRVTCPARLKRVLLRPKEIQMTTCHDMRVGQVYVCEGCGLELEVVSECDECGTDPESCECPPCQFICCGEALELKEA